MSDPRFLTWHLFKEGKEKDLSKIKRDKKKLNFNKNYILLIILFYNYRYQTSIH